MGPVLLAVDASTVNLTADDRLLAETMERRGVEWRPVRWGISVPAGSVVVVPSTWDYVDRPAAFLAWLDDLDACGATAVVRLASERWLTCDYGKIGRV